MTCEELVDISNSEDISYYFANPMWIPPDASYSLPFLPESTDFKFLEDNYGCNCNGCQSSSDDSSGSSPGVCLSLPCTHFLKLIIHLSSFPKSIVSANLMLHRFLTCAGMSRRHLDARSDISEQPSINLTRLREAIDSGNIGDASDQLRHSQPYPSGSRRSLSDSYADESYSFFYYNPEWQIGGGGGGGGGLGSGDKGSDETSYTTAAWPLDTVFCDEEQLCSLELLLNGQCDRACANEACNWDFNDCCGPTFDSTTESLDTQTDTTLLILRMEHNGGATPYDAWNDTLVKRFVANNHRLVGGVLFDQTRNERKNCSETEAEVMWEKMRTGHQVRSPQ